MQCERIAAAASCKVAWTCYKTAYCPSFDPSHSNHIKYAAILQVFWEPLFRGDVRPFRNKTLLLPTFKKIKASVSANNLPTVSLFGISFGHRVKTGLSFPSFRGLPLCPYVRVLKTLWLSLCKQREKGEAEEGEYEHTGQPGQKQVQTTERRKRKGDKAKRGKRSAF